jgi:hypothetical protein
MSALSQKRKFTPARMKSALCQKQALAEECVACQAEGEEARIERTVGRRFRPGRCPGLHDSRHFAARSDDARVATGECGQRRPIEIARTCG